MGTGYGKYFKGKPTVKKQQDLPKGMKKKTQREPDDTVYHDKDDVTGLEK